jgi:hypothetical protein
MSRNEQEVAAYFYENVLGAYKEYVKSRKSPEVGTGRDLAAAQNAAVAISHFKDQLSGDLTLEYEDITAQCPDYALTRDVADIAKHRNLDRLSAQLRTPDAIQEIIVVTTYEDAFGEYHNWIKDIELRLPNGTTRELSEVMTNGINFWCRHLAGHNVSPTFLELPSLSPVEPPPRSGCRTSGPNINIVRGLRFKGLVFHLRRYNYSTGRVEPMDLTGMKVKAQAYTPTHELDHVIQNKSTGEQLRRTIALNPDQSNEFDALKSDEERRNYLSELPQVIAAYASLATQAVGMDSKTTTNT